MKRREMLSMMVAAPMADGFPKPLVGEDLILKGSVVGFQQVEDPDMGTVVMVDIELDKDRDARTLGAHLRLYVSPKRATKLAYGSLVYVNCQVTP